MYVAETQLSFGQDSACRKPEYDTRCRSEMTWLALRQGVYLRS